MKIETPKKAVIGIDVSKATLAISTSQKAKTQIIENNKAAVKSFIKKLKKDGFSDLVVMENTGGYEKLAHRLFCEAGFNVHIAHGKRVYHFAQQKGFFAKTDEIDASIIRRYGEQEDIFPTDKFDQEVEKKKELANLRKAIAELLGSTKQRLKDYLDPFTKETIKGLIKDLEKQLKKLDAELERLVKLVPENEQKLQILQTFTGVGPTISLALLCCFPEIGSLNRAQAAALAGVAPKNRDSGMKNGKRSIAGGRSYIRTLLFMSSLSSIIHNKQMKAYYNRLKEKGKASKVALTAVMRKIILTLNAMIRDNKPWEKNLAYA